MLGFLLESELLFTSLHDNLHTNTNNTANLKEIEQNDGCFNNVLYWVKLA